MGALVRRMLIGLAALLAGCAALQQQPDVLTHVTTVTVNKATPVPCIDAADVPPEFVTAMPAGDPAAIDVARKSAAASADLRWLKPRYAAARALLLGCTEVKWNCSSPSGCSP